VKTLTVDVLRGLAFGFLIAAMFTVGLASAHDVAPGLVVRSGPPWMGVAAVVELVVGVVLLVVVLWAEHRFAQQLTAEDELHVMSAAARGAVTQERVDHADREWVAENVRAALMPIHPLHAQRILAGTKTVELRRKPLRDDTTDVLIYETAPTSAIVGAFHIDWTYTGDSRAVVSFAKAAAISKAAALRYLTARGNRTGHAIGIGSVVRFDTPVPLERIGIHHAPQAPRYLTTDQVVAVGYVTARAINPTQPQAEESAA
jgi:predicted transcriptional regulator